MTSREETPADRDLVIGHGVAAFTLLANDNSGPGCPRNDPDIHGARNHKKLNAYNRSTPC